MFLWVESIALTCNCYDLFMMPLFPLVSFWLLYVKHVNDTMIRASTHMCIFRHLNKWQFPFYSFFQLIIDAGKHSRETSALYHIEHYQYVRCCWEHAFDINTHEWSVNSTCCGSYIYFRLNIICTIRKTI